jgi:hypothetical protein
MAVCQQALGQYEEGSCISTAALATLARLATACARLHHHDTVLALPDAVLAITLHEASNEAKVHSHHFTLRTHSLASGDRLGACKHDDCMQ